MSLWKGASSLTQLPSTHKHTLDKMLLADISPHFNEVFVVDIKMMVRVLYKKGQVRYLLQ